VRIAPSAGFGEKSERVTPMWALQSEPDVMLSRSVSTKSGPVKDRPD
jgi:hypothetical protein